MNYQRSTKSGCKDIGVRMSEFVAKTQFLYFIFSEAFIRKQLLFLKNTTENYEF